MLTSFVLLPGLYFVFTDADRLRVDAEPAVAVVALQQGGRHLVALPELAFELSVSPHCAGRGERESLSITIADTQTTLRGDALRAGNSIDVSLRVSASQLAPVALQDFCVDPAREGESILIGAALTAHASLRCTRTDKPSIVFAATPLDIRVDCVRSGVEAGPAVAEP
ncbi:MAG TPA: hypothetical protein VLS87_08445 [Woeseiaceae bacterium]|nr:hypothetical protein [Woeseiaceae bacterium]